MMSWRNFRCVMRDRSTSCDSVSRVRPISQADAEQMRTALKTIAGYYNPAATQDGAQAAARLARETLEAVGLFYEADARGSASGSDPRDA